MGLTERHWFENEDVPENYEWALEDAVYNSRTNKKPEDSAPTRKGGKVGMIVITTIDALPDYCYECPCHDGESGYCQADKERRYSEYRPFWCPLKEIHDDQERQCSEMTDRDKAYLLKEVQRTLDQSDATVAYCLCQRWILKETVALLKEQEPKQVLDVYTTNLVEEIEIGHCPSCRRGITNQTDDPTKFCWHCGQAVKWNE